MRDVDMYSSQCVSEEGNEPMSLCFSDDVTVLISAGRDTHVRMYDPVTIQVKRGTFHGSLTAQVKISLI